MVSLPDDLWARPEVAELTDAAFRAFVAGWCYAHQHRTDGYLPAGALRVLGAAPRVVRELAAGVWEAQGDGSYRIVAYLETNSSRAEEDAFEAAQREQRRRAGQASGEARRRTAEERAVERGANGPFNGPFNGSSNGPFNGEATARSTGGERLVRENSGFRSTARSISFAAAPAPEVIIARAGPRGESTSSPSPTPPPPAAASTLDGDVLEAAVSAVEAAVRAAGVKTSRFLADWIREDLRDGYTVAEIEAACREGALQNMRSYAYVQQVVRSNRIAAARARLEQGGGEFESEDEYEEDRHGVDATEDSRGRPGTGAHSDGDPAAVARGGGGRRTAARELVPVRSVERDSSAPGDARGHEVELPWDGEQPEPIDIAGRWRGRALRAIEPEPEGEPEPGGPFDGMTLAQRETMHEYVLGWERFAFEGEDTVADIRQMVAEFAPDDLRWVRQEARRQRIWPPWPKGARELLANRGVEPVVSEPGPGSRDVYLATPQEWADWAEWQAPESVANTWQDAIRNLGEDPALALAYESVIRRARLVCGRWPEWVVAVPGGALATMERLRAVLLRALCEAGGPPEMGLRIVREREGRRA